MPDGVLSLTKHYVLHDLVDQLAQIHPGMSFDEVRSTLESPHVELADDLFQYENGQVLDSVLLETCRSGVPGSVRLVWVALVAADWRLQNLITKFLTNTSGQIEAGRYSRVAIQNYLGTLLNGDTQKAASNVAHYFEQARILIPIKRGPQIVGVEAFLDTSSAVPIAVAYLAERYGWEDPLSGALRAEVNAWLNLTTEEFAEAWSSVPEKRSEPTSESNGADTTTGPAPLPPTQLDKPYIEEDENAGINFTGRREFDPEVLERASKVHRRTQNLIAKWAGDRGFEPLRPTGSPKFDAAWWDDSTLWLVEVKSVRAENESTQIRLGLGQLLDYQFQLKGRGVEVTPVLALSDEPSDPRWTDLCDSYGVLLTWPPFDSLDNRFA